MGILFSLNVSANNIIDVYGTSLRESERIISKFAQSVLDIENLLGEQAKESINKKYDEKAIRILEKKRLLVEKIKQEGNFSYVDFDTVYYPESRNYYTTIEVIKKNQLTRQRFISSEPKIEHLPPKHDVINEMILFNKKIFQLMLDNKLDSSDNYCPVYHCIVGFNDPQIKPYLQRFNNAAVMKRNLIIDTLNKDSDPERRSAAAYLIGHFQNPREIVSLLLPHVNDPSNMVRNNVMRTLGTTLYKANIRRINVMPFLRLLDSPYATDRNKALYIISKAVEAKQSRALLIHHKGETLLSLLRLKQPNNHDMAYLILKKISHQDFGDDLLAWERWLTAARNSFNKKQILGKI